MPLHRCHSLLILCACAIDPVAAHLRRELVLGLLILLALSEAGAKAGAAQAPADTNSKVAQAIEGNQTWPVTVDYQWEKTVIQDDFLLWLGVADTDGAGLLPSPPSVVPIRQVDWSFHADSSSGSLQQPTGGTHKAPDTAPVVTGQTANQRRASPASYQWQDGNQNTNLHP